MRTIANRSRRSRGFGWIQFAVVAAALLTTTAAAAAVHATSQAARPSALAETISSNKAPTISTRKLPKLGTVLVNGQGRTLYMFVPDKRKKVTCVRSCAAVWPPVKLSKGQKALASGQAKSSLLGSDPNPAGGRVVTYAGWPLYTYVADTSPGTAKGQALNLNGGLWYVLAPSGKLIRTKP
jgi:predicted lipoprotein with Yx(FWY)xxD motif